MQASEDVYHHYIPSFILRRFKLPNPSAPQQKSDRKKRGKSRQVDSQELVYYYDPGTGKLETPPIAKVYCIINLYKDANDLENVYRLEEKLTTLENQVAAVIGKLHDSVGGGTFQIERRDLVSLRKFIQIMCYRKQAFYFDEHHADYILSAGFLKYLRENKGPEDKIEAWLRFLDYILDTPHNDIMNRAAEFEKKDSGFGSSSLLQSFFGSLWPTRTMVEDLVAEDYSHLAGDFYLGIIEAAPDTEFITSHNTFGLWEGMINRLPDAHRLFVVSPRIALLFRSNLLDGDISFTRPLLVRSPLIDIPLKRAQVRYVDGCQSMTVKELRRYQASRASQRGMIKFKITKLTKQQTQNVNTSILLNASPDGAITFLSKGNMRKTLESYMDVSNRLVVETQKTYVGLMDQLANEGSAVPVDIPAPSNPHIRTDGASRCFASQGMETGQGVETDDSFARLSELGAALPEILADADDTENKQVKQLLNDIRTGKISCKSDYDRAYQIYWAASVEEDACRYMLLILSMITAVVLARIMRLKGDGIRARSNILQVNPLAKLVETLPVDDSAEVMSTLKALIADAPVPPYPDAQIRDVLYDAIIVGLLDCVAREMTFVLPALFPGISLLQ